MNKTRNREIMAILRKPREDWTLDESVTLVANLEHPQIYTPRHTLLLMLIEELVAEGWGLDMALTLASIDVHGLSNAWEWA